jgi:hypothetical protein
MKKKGGDWVPSESRMGMQLQYKNKEVKEISRAVVDECLPAHCWHVRLEQILRCFPFFVRACGSDEVQQRSNDTKIDKPGLPQGEGAISNCGELFYNTMEGVKTMMGATKKDVSTGVVANTESTAGSLIGQDVEIDCW